MAQTRARTFVRAPRRQNLWSNILTDFATAALASGKTGGGLGGGGTGLAVAESITLVRTRGQLMVHFDPTTANDVVRVGFGLGIFSNDAFGIGITAVPGPLTDAGWDWVYHKLFMMGPVFSATETDNSINQNVMFEIDSKAMRKMKDNQTLGWVGEMQVVSGGGTIDFSATARHLFKLA